MTLCLALSAILIPAAAHLPKWVEDEIVMAVWWAVWVGLLTWLLFWGYEVDSDSRVRKRPVWSPSLGWSDSLDWLGCMAGCDFIGLAVVAVVAILISFWLLVELVIPGLALLLVLSIGGMLARAVNDRHDCRGRLLVSLAWAVIWATLYVLPVAVVVVLVSRAIHPV